jgi:hypothetical protein
MFYSLKVKNMITRNRDRQQWTKIAVEGKIFAFGFSKKDDLSLLSMECPVLDWGRAFDQLVSVDAHLCLYFTYTVSVFAKEYRQRNSIVYDTSCLIRIAT